MKINHSEKNGWRKLQRNMNQGARKLEAEATSLAKTAAVTRLVAMAETEQDAMHVLVDMIGLGLTATAQELAQRNGHPVPPAYQPSSKLLSGFTKVLAEKTAATLRLFDATEQERLKGIFPGFVKALDTNDPALQRMVTDLILMQPDEAAAWIRAHLTELESRFAS